MVAAAAASSDNVTAVEARYALGTSLGYLGEIVRGRSLLEEAIALYRPAQHSAYASLYLLDPSVTCRGQTARFGVLLGYPGQAIRRAREAIVIAESLRHPQSLAYAYLFLAYTHTLREEPEATRDLAELAITLAQEQGLPQIAEWGKILRGWASAKQGMVEDGVRDIQTSLAAQRAIHAEIDRPMCLGLLVRWLRAAERLDDAFDTVVSAIARVDSTNEHWYAAELHRTYADLLAHRGDPEGAQRELAFAAVIAGQQSARLLELRIAVTAARLFLSPASLEKLRGVYEWFTEGFDIPDLIAARGLIADLSGSMCA